MQHLQPSRRDRSSSFEDASPGGSSGKSEKTQPRDYRNIPILPTLSSTMQGGQHHPGVAGRVVSPGGISVSSGAPIVASDPSTPPVSARTTTPTVIDANVISSNLTPRSLAAAATTTSESDQKVQSTPIATASAGVAATSNNSGRKQVYASPQQGHAPMHVQNQQHLISPGQLQYQNASPSGHKMQLVVPPHLVPANSQQLLSGGNHNIPVGHQLSGQQQHMIPSGQFPTGTIALIEIDGKPQQVFYPNQPIQTMQAMQGQPMQVVLPAGSNGVGLPQGHFFGPGAMGQPQMMYTTIPGLPGGR